MVVINYLGVNGSYWELTSLRLVELTDITSVEELAARGILSPLCYESVSFVAERTDRKPAVAKVTSINSTG
jgi:hypothetical protein